MADDRGLVPPQIDVSHLAPLTQPIALAAAEVYLRHTRPWFIGLIAHGSAVKGGLIPGCSDLDLQLYLHDAAFSAGGALPLPLGLAIQRDLALIDPAPCSAIQCLVFRPRLRPGYLGPIPGAYTVLAGRLPIPEATDQALQAAAAQALATPTLTLPYVAEMLFQHGGWELARRVRKVCTAVWPALYHVVTLQQQDGVRVWGLRKDVAINLLPPESPLYPPLHAFYAAVQTYYPAQSSVAHALAVIEHGTAFLQATAAWWQQQDDAGRA